jgi:anti-sigma regulatory factor (Ser/Thr protein kinase)
MKEEKIKKTKNAVEYSIEIPQNTKYFFLVRKFLENILSTEKFSEKEKEEMIIAVNEACDRLIRLESNDFKKIKINIKVRITPRKIVILLHYKGETELAKYFKSYSEEQIILESVKDKIGNYLMEKSADEISFTRSTKKGNNIKIIKYRKD